MPRTVDSSLLAAFSSGYVEPVTLMQIQFRSQSCCAWSGVGSLAWNGLTFLGVGSLGALGDIQESADVHADGSSVALSGIDPVWLGESLNDIWLGAPVRRWTSAVQPGTRTLIGMPYLHFFGQVDKPSIYTGADKIAISLKLETRLINHARASNRRYTAADQHANGYPDDTGFNSVEILNDIALVWG
ncbi:hypothetical protein GOB94_14105 [Granulicella sp. 5B5]|uniref:hypothetical protein n=1 Tax=Granulicella sp. 5B5 TaxID=1617967 RepID=UPI0015F62A2B|nr:hypothetical protein [Granulicella sp. 5B5]QMV19699.1 hypothetical protein GOB94_14105 [Granulicella sp. 5B5]